jgi:hypothetical protein
LTVLELSIGTAIRSVGIAILAVILAHPVRDLLLRLRGWQWWIAFTLLAAPSVWPHLVTGYCHANSTRLWIDSVHPSLGSEALYALLVLGYLLPLAVGLLHITPRSDLDRRERYVFRLLGRKAGDFRNPSSIGFLRPIADRFLLSMRFTRQDWLRINVWDPLKSWLPIGLVLSLIAFQEFDLASALGILTWTVYLFDAQVGGLPWSAALQQALIPLLMQLAAVIPLVFWFVGFQRKTDPWQRPESSGNRNSLDSVSWVCLGASFMLFCGYPGIWILCRALPGWGRALANTSLRWDILLGMSVATISAMSAYVVARVVHKSRMLAILWSLPGLLGAMTASLGVLAAFQISAFHAWYQTPIPWWLGLTLLVLPRAILCVAILASWQSSPSHHLAILLCKSSNAIQVRSGWRLRRASEWLPIFTCIAVLAYWGYLDVTTAAILAPTGVVPAPARLYNLMHYGQSAVLSAMTIEATLVPLVVLALARVLAPRFEILIERFRK